MNYITAEMFMKQPEEVQDVFRKWLEDNLNVHDWVKLIEEDMILYVDSVMDSRKDAVNVGRVFYLDRCLCWTSIYDVNVVPLLTESQLRNFIEKKLSGVIIKIELVMRNFYDIEVHGHDGGVADWQVEANNILDLYWKIACKIVLEKD